MTRQKIIDDEMLTIKRHECMKLYNSCGGLDPNSRTNRLYTKLYSINIRKLNNLVKRLKFMKAFNSVM